MKQNTPSCNYPYTRRALSLALLSSAVCFVVLIFGGSSLSQAQAPEPAPQTQEQQQSLNEPADVVAFRQAVGGEIKPMIVELKDEPGVLRKVAAEQAGQAMSMEQTISYAQELMAKQNAFLASLGQRGVRALLRETDVTQVNGATRHIQYRFTYLLNGFVAYVAAEDIELLRAQPEVAIVSEPAQMTFNLDRAIDHSLGTQPNVADRRAAVYGATEEFRPTDTGDHPETPRPKIDGFEGQGLNMAVIDSGVDYRHPMFGGTGLNTPLPRISGEAEDPSDNRKVIYFYAFSKSVGDPTDDFGHGTLVASCAAGFGVDGNTPPRAGFGTGRDGTGIGPTPNGERLFGTAPQARIMAYKVCEINGQCNGDIELSIEDAASPVTLIAGASEGESMPSMVSKPVADVINLSLGDPSGNPAGANARAANNAALAGTIVVASAGNAGPGPGTIGSPSAATLAVSVAASLDPGSVAAADVLAPEQIPLETCDDDPRPAGCDTGVQPGPSPEEGASSNANTAGSPTGIKIAPVIGSGALPVEENPGEPTTNTGSVSAHYVYVERRVIAGNPPPPVPASVTNRIAIVKGTGAFTTTVNPVALQNPAAILLVSDITANAFAVVGAVPTFTISLADANALLDRLTEGDDDRGDPANGAVSRLPIRLADNVSLPAFQGSMAGFSSRGPSDNSNARFGVVKPDVTAPGVGVFGAATPDGGSDEATGLANPIGYTTANGTSFSGPITAGAITLLRQRVREELQLDTTDLNDDGYRAKRFDTVTVSRALLQNTATNLRDGLGTPQGDASNSVASVNDMGSGHINVAAALSAKAIMTSPTQLLTEPREFGGAAPITVQLPTASFGLVPVLGVNGTVVRTREVIIRDVTAGQGGGTYNLTMQKNRPVVDSPGFKASFTAADGVTPITSVSVPAGGQASFLVRVEADSTQITVDPTEFQWYVTATATSGQTLRMPFYFRATRATIPNAAAPVQQDLEGTEQPPANAGGCQVDTNGSYSVNWDYTGPLPIGFRVQEATRNETLFFDPADELLVAGENSRWGGSVQWTTQENPETGSPAYFIPDTANQNESLTMKNFVRLPAGGATLSFVTNQATELNFDFAIVEVSTDGTNFENVATFSGSFVGTRRLDISRFGGRRIKVRFRLTSDARDTAPGWYVEDIRVEADDFATVGDTGTVTSFNITGQPAGTFSYRIAALFTNPLQENTTVIGPYSNARCVTVAAGPAPTAVVSRKFHGGFKGDIPLPLTGTVGIEPRDQATAPGTHQVVFTFPSNVTVGGAELSSGTGTVTSFTQSGTEIAVNLSGVANAQTIIVTLTGVNNVGNVSVPMGVLLGDVNATRVVDGNDVSAVQAKTRQGANSTNFRTDVNATGLIDGNDVSAVQGKTRTRLP